MAVPIGWANRAHETTQTTGSSGPYIIDPSSAANNMVSLVDAVKQISGVGTGPWTVEYVVSDDNDFEIGISTLEEGTGPSGEDRLMRDGTIHDSSNGGSAVVWGVGTRDVFIAPSSEKMAALTDKLSTNGLIEKTGDDTYAIQPIGAKGRDLTNSATAAAARSTLGSTTVGDAVFIAATVAAARTAFKFTVGTIASRPGSDVDGAVYLASDSKELYLYLSGSGWVMIAAGDALRPADEGHGNGIDADTLDGVEGSNHLRWTSGEYVDVTIDDPLEASVSRYVEHGFNPSTPRLFQVCLQCKTAQYGWSAGDIVDSSAVCNYGADFPCIVSWVDDTYIGAVVGGSPSMVRRDSPGSKNSLTPSYWKVIGRVWK